MKKMMLAVCVFAGIAVNAVCQDLKPNDSCALVNVKVESIDKGTPMPGEKVSLQSLKTKKMYSGITDATGKFQILMPKNAEYKIFYREFTESADYNQTLPIPAAENQMLTFNFTIKVELPKTFTLKNTFFDSGNATLKKESNKELDELADFMKHQTTMVIEIAGYTDNVGNDETNLKLSQQRAEAVRNYLISKGIAADKVQAKGYGSTNAVASNDTAEGRQQNRRTEIHIIKN